MILSFGRPSSLVVTTYSSPTLCTYTSGEMYGGSSVVKFLPGRGSSVEISLAAAWYSPFHEPAYAKLALTPQERVRIW